MRRLLVLLVLLVLTALAALAVAAPAPATAAGPPAGVPCRFDAVQADAVGGDAWNAVLAGGPVAAAGEPVSVTCAIRVGDLRYAAPAAASVTGPVLPGVGVLAPAAVSYRAGDADPVAVCTSATVGATTWHWDGAAWTTDSGASCPASGLPGRDVLVAVLEALPEPARAVVGYVLCLAYPSWGPRTTCDVTEVLDSLAAADAVVCPVLAALPGVPGVVEVRPDGDVYVLGELFWDCPPYDVWGAGK
jgi:hypothetical protein